MMTGPPGRSEGTNVLLLEATDDFEVSWPDPADAERSWVWDEMHTPRPLAPMSQLLNDAFTSRTFDAPQAVANGYAFTNRQPGSRFPAPDRSEREGRTAAQVWGEFYQPRARGVFETLRRRDYAAMSTATLAALLDGLVEEYGRGQYYTMVPVFMLMMEGNRFIDFCEEQFGDDGEVMAATMLQGVANESAAAGEGLAALAQMAAQSAELAAAIRDGRYDEIGRYAGGQQFTAALDQYLDVYGWRAESWAELDRPTWAEDPSVPLGLIGRYLAEPKSSPRVGYQRAARQRAEAIDDARKRLANNALRARFDELLAVAERYVPVREERAFWQLAIGGVLRLPLLELGRRFVTNGDLNAPDDTIFLYVEELQRLAAGTLEGAKALVARRRSALAHQQTLRPPPYIGTEPPPPPPGMPNMRMMTPEPPEEPQPEHTLTGVSASPGVVRGRARVIATLEEAGRLEPGDVLVCRSTAAPWTPLFAVAGAVVTNTGGILSHSAIVAREYAIPCVVGTRDATDRIADGAMITVDGGAGTVTIER
jgi:pyruvate,water dikinase